MAGQEGAPERGLRGGHPVANHCFRMSKLEPREVECSLAGAGRGQSPGVPTVPVLRRVRGEPTPGRPSLRGPAGPEAGSDVQAFLPGNFLLETGLGKKGGCPTSGLSRGQSLR